MAITEERPAAVAPTPAFDAWTSRDRWAGWVLAAGWLCLLLTLVATGDRLSSYSELTEDLRAGEVSEVELVGALPRGNQGYAMVTLRWRDGLVVRTATVVQSSRERTDGDRQPVIVGSVEDGLRVMDPDVRVIDGGELRGGSYWEALGWRGPGWLFFPYLTLLGGTLMLISGPRPWRATRWAWAWLVLMVPLVGISAYFLFGGPTGLFHPKDPRRIVLTGGWAFLLALLLGGGSAAS